MAMNTIITKWGKKGFYPLFTTLGLLMILMVISLTIQWNAGEDSSYSAHIDRLSWLKINSAVANVRTMISSSLKDTLYNAIMDTGKLENGTVNKYLLLSKEQGWKRIVDDVRAAVSTGFNSEIPKLADYYDGYQSTFVFEEGINVTLGELTENDLDIVETDDGLLGVARMPLTVTNRYRGWEAMLFEANLTIPLEIRLKDVFERAWDFHTNYPSTAQWTFTGALYARAYLNAYASTRGPLLKEAHYDFDPVATLLFGDLETVEAFGKDAGSALDIGAIPAATWLAEWKYLSEPSFLPAGFDMASQDASKARNAITNSYRMGEIEEEACRNATDKARCKSLYDPETLRSELAVLKDKMDAFKEIADDMASWLTTHDGKAMVAYLACKSCYEEFQVCYSACHSKKCRNSCRDKRDRCEEDYDDRGRDKKVVCQQKQLAKMRINSMSCDEFRDDATEIVGGAVEALGELDAGACRGELDYARDYTDRLPGTDTRVRAQFYDNEEDFGFDETDDYCRDSIKSLDDLRSLWYGGAISEDAIDDSKCGRAKGDCINDADCTTSNDCDITCSYPACMSGSSYDCIGDAGLGYSRTVTCRLSGQIESESIAQCTCRCRVSVKLLIRLNKDFRDIYAYVSKTAKALEESYDAMKGQLTAREKSNELRVAADKLETNEAGYDVFSRMDPELVKYDKGKFVGGNECYFNPTFIDRDNGICGDSVESGITYTIQIAAAALTAMFSGGLATPLLTYAKDFFPMFIESEVKYNLTETIIDDANRVVLRNVGGEGGELYTYAPFEFEIYKDRQFGIGSATAGRIIVYVYLPAVKGGLQRIMDGLASGECAGEQCE